MRSKGHELWVCFSCEFWGRFFHFSRVLCVTFCSEFHAPSAHRPTAAANRRIGAQSVARSMSETSFLSASLSAELLTKLTRLGEISEHVRDISRKIADLREDPLPTQLDNSVPDYVNVLNAHTTMLRRRHWVFVVAGLYATCTL